MPRLEDKKENLRKKGTKGKGKNGGKATG